jgi:hypothetical protein
MSSLIVQPDLDLRVLYRRINADEGIRQSINEWMLKVGRFLTVMKKLDPGFNIEGVFRQRNPESMAGYTHIRTVGDIEDLARNGNMREKMSFLFNFLRKFSPMVFDAVEALPDFDPEDSIMKEFEEQRIPRVFKRIMRMWRRILKKHFRMQTDRPLVTMKKILKDVSEDTWVDKTLDERRYPYKAQGAIRMLFTMPPRFGGSLRDAYFDCGRVKAEHAFGVLKRELLEPLSNREMRIVKELKGGEYSDWNEATTDGSSRLSWVPGRDCYGVNEKSMFSKLLDQSTTMTGFSGTVEMYLMCSALFGTDPLHVLLATLPWMGDMDHTAFEIIIPGLPYVFHDKRYRNEEGKIDLSKPILDVVQQLTDLAIQARPGRAGVSGQEGGFSGVNTVSNNFTGLFKKVNGVRMVPSDLSVSGDDDSSADLRKFDEERLMAHRSQTRVPIRRPGDGDEERMREMRAYHSPLDHPPEDPPELEAKRKAWAAAWTEANRHQIEAYEEERRIRDERANSEARMRVRESILKKANQ